MLFNFLSFREKKHQAWEMNKFFKKNLKNKPVFCKNKYNLVTKYFTWLPNTEKWMKNSANEKLYFVKTNNQIHHPHI